MHLKLPHAWKDIPLAKMQALMSDMDELSKLSAMTGVPLSELKTYPMSLIEAGLDHMRSIRETSTFAPKIEIKGKRYGFINDWDAFTLGEWIDTEEYTKDFWPNAHKLMAILYREMEWELGDNYQLKPYTAKEDFKPFLEISADMVHGCLLFFWNTRNEQLNSLRSSLLTAAHRATSPPNGVGIQRSSPSRMKNFYKWTRSQLDRLKLFFSTSRS
jgi:hypothetical protein